MNFFILFAFLLLLAIFQNTLLFFPFTMYVQNLQWQGILKETPTFLSVNVIKEIIPKRYDTIGDTKLIMFQPLTLITETPSSKYLKVTICRSNDHDTFFCNQKDGFNGLQRWLRTTQTDRHQHNICLFALLTVLQRYKNSHRLKFNLHFL